MDGVLHLVSPDPPIRRKTPLPVEVACASGQADDQALLRVDSINKQYADQAVLADVAFDIQAGEIIGIIGPNGAGKTTLLEVLAGILPAETSDVQWLGRPLPPSRRREAMFYLPDGVRPYQDQPVTRVLAFFADVYRRSADEITGTIEAVGLTPALHKRVHSLSKGYGRRLMLALGLLTPHPLLLMDEPFDGFDLRQTREIVGVLRKEVAKGRTLALAIHQLLDAERVCDRFILLADGRVRGVGTLNDLRARTGRSAGSHREFAMASGEMSEAEFRSFLADTLGVAARVSRDGAVHFVCMDWRHMDDVSAVGRTVYGERLNLCIWNKSNAGMGSLYRSKHELVFIYRVGTAPHLNMVELGRHGRNRTNVWDYASVNSLRGSRREDLASHPTVKPTGLVADAISDVTRRGDLVLDLFLGSGTTLMAAERTGRRFRGLDIDPAYVVLLDNMDLATLAEAAKLAKGRVVLEASGGVTKSSIAKVAATGVDYVSSGALTHSAPNFDVALDIDA